MTIYSIAARAKLLWPWLFALVLLAACTPYIVAPAVADQPAKAPTSTVSTSATPAAESSTESPVEFVWALPMGTLSYPKHLAVDKQGAILVPDTGNDRVQKIDANGNLLMNWGSTGSSEGQFIFICPGVCKPACPPLPEGWPRCYHMPSGGVAVDEQGNVFVSDFNSRIQKFDSDGNFLTQWGSRGKGEGQFLSSPDGLAVDKAGNVYAADAHNHRIQKFDNQGNFLLAWGKKDGEDLSEPAYIALDPQGYVYVTDLTGVQKFDSNGKFLTKWGSIGGGEGQFADAPEGVAVDSKGSVYVVDNIGNRVLKFDGNGNFLGQWGKLGIGDGEFSSPSGIGIDAEDNIYIAERANHRVQKFRQK